MYTSQVLMVATNNMYTSHVLMAATNNMHTVVKF